MHTEQQKILDVNNLVEGRWATSMMGGMQIVFQDPFSSTSPRMTVLDVVREPHEKSVTGCIQ